MPPRPSHLNNFDFLRFLFASFVIFSHSYALLGTAFDDPFYGWWGRTIAEIGVSGFFVLSGYLTQQSLSRSSSIASFAIKRLRRIFPGLIVAVLFATFFIGPLTTTLPVRDYLSHQGTWAYLSNIVLLPRYPGLPGVFEQHRETAVNGSLWTLRYELAFYGGLALFFYFRLRQKRVLVPVLLAVCYLGTYLSKAELLPPPAATALHYPLLLGGHFLAGMLLSLYAPEIEKHKTRLGCISAPVFFATLLFSRSQPEFLNFLAFAVMIISFGLHYSKALQFTQITGDISYGTYIYAFPIQQALIVWLQPGNVLTLMIPSFLLAWLAGYLSWTAIERPFLKRRQPLAPPAGTTVQIP